MIRYRDATADDLGAICRLGQEVNAAHQAAWPDVFAPAGDTESQEALWRQGIGVPDATTFVAERDGQVIAFVSVFVANDKNPLLLPVTTARLGSVGVAKAHRGQGIGTELMRRAEQWAASKGAVRITLNVWAFNERAVELYRELGYEIRSHAMGKRLLAQS